MSIEERRQRRGRLHRWRAVVCFSMLLMASAAAPSLADDPPAEPREVLPPAYEEVDLQNLPGAADVTAAIRAAEEEEAERELWLASPEAVQQRELSQTAHIRLSSDEAEALLGDTFSEQLRILNSDPARSLSDGRLLSPSRDETAGTVVKEGGDGAVLDAEIPLRTENEEGELRKVDLSLEATASGFETTNALVDVEIPDSPAEPIEVGEEYSVAISQQGAALARDGRLFGDENVFYPNVLPDTDMLVSPIAGGVEVFNQLRSERSPEDFRFDIEVPDGATLRAQSGWGAEVVMDGEPLATIPEPVAIDAQGTDVPVEMTVEGNTLLLHVDHRDGDYAMPILLDPILENNSDWIYGQNHDALDLGVWGFYKNVAGMYGSTYCIYHCFGQPSNVRGLFVSAQSGTYWPGQFAQWSYSAPNVHSFVETPTLAPYVRYDHGCNAATTPHKQPHDYFGVWGHNNQWVYTSVNSANQPGHTYTLPFRGLAVVFGLGSGGGQFSIPCWRDLYAAGAHVWLDDWNPPWIEGGLAGIHGIPSGWVSDETPFTITAVAKDEGLGIKNVRIHHDGGGINYDIPNQNLCAGTRRSPCYTTHTAFFDLHGGNFSEGERNAWLNADDATGKYTGNYHFTMRVDNSPPEMTLKGEFAEETGEVGSEEVPAGKGDQLSLPVYNLRIEATDIGSYGEANLKKRSGVEDIEIWLDGVEQQDVPWEPQPCPGPNYSCPMNVTYPVKLSKLTTSGKHVLEVVAVDQVGKRLKRNIEFEYFPATGMKDEYVMHYFPLPDGNGNEAEEEHPDRPELAVNVMNGNLVYRETDIDVEGTAALDLEVERYYNSMLPENEDTEWGDGWTLAQTPELDPIKTGGSPVPNEAEILVSSGAIEDEVDLPTEAGAEKFDPALQATLTKKPGGGYEMTDETGESATSVAFDATGQTEALLSDGYAKVDYSYEGGELAEIEVSDPSTFAADPAELQIPEPELISEPIYDSAFGSNGSADGQLKSPGDVAVDSQGNLWVVDKGNNRVQKFDSTGKYLAKFGSWGSGNGQFSRPTAIAVAPNGDLLVTDAANGRVQRFSPSGTFLSKFGSKGTGNGQFAGFGPEGIAVDVAGNTWVSDTYGGRLQKFNAAGEFVQIVGSKGSGSGHLGEPTGIDVAPNGDVWVADRQNHRISVFNAAGEFVSNFGSIGSGDGQFSHPEEVEIDKLGNVWVGDRSNSRIQQFDLNGQFKAKFGAAGSGPGQFSFAFPLGIAADSKGRLWVADVNNHRVQRWLVPVERPAFLRSFGGTGSGDGQLSFPADVAVGVEGSILVVDKSNNRIQRFDESGKYLGKFGSYGGGNGQFNRPTAIAVDRDGNLLVTDSNNHRVQKFSPDGQFIAKFGSMGILNGYFLSPEGIATDFAGNIFVADSSNGRIQKFNEEGEFLAVIGSKGSAAGQLGKPVGIDVDSEGRIWVGDCQNHRVSVFEGDGDFIGSFGSLGTGPGQFNRPTAIEIDAHDNVWVADQVNGRVQRFDLDGLFVGQFGSQGTGDGQFSFPTSATPVGIATDRSGQIWVTDVNSHRIQQWMLGHYVAEPQPLDLSDGDPKVEVTTADDLVTSISGNAAGTHTYEHEGDFLVSYEGPEGETLYEKDPTTGQLSKVTLPNGTWGQIAYYDDRRVQSVTVAVGGADPKTTVFHYEDGPPRRSIVTPPGKPQITYDIGKDGSVFKWWHKDEPPEIIKLTGSLGFDKNGQEVPAGDLILDVEADSPHGVASIQIIANGNQLVSEKTCEQDPDPEIECTRLEDLWVTDTASLAPGVLNLEVIATGENERSASKRWSVTIPQTPPPVPGYPVPPKFSEIQQFREDYGLEVVFPVANERELVERIFNLINAWHSPGTPAGEVARASWERWGVPLRPADVAEMEYRERYIDYNVELIEAWAEANYPGTYAGYYVDHNAGGTLHIGFTQDQGVRLTDLEVQLPLEAEDRLAVYPAPPLIPRASLASAFETLSTAMDANATFRNLVTDLSIDESGNDLSIGTTNVPQTQEIVTQLIGSQVPVNIYPGGKPVLTSGRHRTSGRMRAGDRILNANMGCTASFGAFEERAQKSNGEMITARFLLTAGHCFSLDAFVHRSDRADFSEPDDWAPVGQVTRKAFKPSPATGGYATDGLAIRVKIPDLVPHGIFGEQGNLVPTGPSSKAKVGNTLCYSGATLDGVSCGEVKRKAMTTLNGVPVGVYNVKFRKPSRGGDSGAPVWNPRTGASVGVLSGIYDGTGTSLVTPLLHPKGLNNVKVPGFLHHPDMFDLHLITGD